MPCADPHELRLRQPLGSMRRARSNEAKRSMEQNRVLVENPVPLVPHQETVAPVGSRLTQPQLTVWSHVVI